MLPAATDTGLARLSLVRGGGLEPNQNGDYIRFSQADQLLAAERAEKEKLEAAWLEAEGIISDLQADNAALVHDLNRIKDHETELVNDNAAKDAAYERLEQQAIKDRKLRDEAQNDADLWRFSVDMGDQPSLLVKVWQQHKGLEADNAAQAARIKELEARLFDAANAEPGEHQEILDALEAHNSGEEQ
ncbi:hypothetical protein HED49_22795 [Ochrobactrum daejeonense]|nr:hypothetical protein [Brucella daejeonensis]